MVRSGYMEHVWQWLLNFMGVNFGQNAFSTHMYNFWSGFGGDITEFALIGVLATIYRQTVKRSGIGKVIEVVRKDVTHKKSKQQ